jgi:hypothetical protein
LDFRLIQESVPFVWYWTRRRDASTGLDCRRE